MEKSNFVPAYKFNSTDEVLLWEGESVLEYMGDKIPGNGRIVFSYFPKPVINIFFEIDDAEKFISSDFNTEAKINIGNTSIDTLIVSFADCLKMVPKLEPVYLCEDTNQEANEIIFHLFNYVDFYGNENIREKRDSKTKLINRYILKSDEWIIEIKSLFETDENINKIRTEGGCHLTHIGRIIKRNSQSISIEEGKNGLNLLRFLLSFTKGTWCNPAFAIGFDSEGNRVWQRFSTPDRDRSSSNWFSMHNGKLDILFPLFERVWNNDNWNKTLRDVLYFYLYANCHPNATPIDISIILSQTALERLSYEYAVNHKKLITRNGFDPLWASDKLRILFSSLNVPLDAGNILPEFKKAMASNKWLDTPHAITHIRNSLVHPKKNDLSDSDVVDDVWKLSLWYLELSILAICGYNATYQNRLKIVWSGEVENVPWLS